MRPLFVLPTLALGLGLAACGPQTVTTTRTLPMPTAAAPSLATCGGDALLTYVGQPLALLPASGGWRSLRVIKPGMMVTMDYSATRLNARVDAEDRILSLTCG